MNASAFMIRAFALSKTYHLPGGRRVEGLAPASFEISSGTCLGVVGESAAGKSTLLRLLAGQIQPTGGKLIYAEGLSPQSCFLSASDENPLPVDPMPPPPPGLRAEANKYVATVFSALQSLGETVSLRLARDLLRPEPILLLDDPPGLNESTARAIQPAIDARLRQLGRALIIATRDADVALILCSRVLVLRAGHLVRDTPVSGLIGEPGRQIPCLIRLRGYLDARRMDWFGGLEIHIHDGETLLTGTLPDEHAVYGLIERARDLGLALISVETGWRAARAQLVEWMRIG